MDYGALLARAWSLFWRFKYLWLLGILGGASVVSSGFSFNFPSTGVELPDQVPGWMLPGQATDWMRANTWFLFLFLQFFLLLLLLFALGFFIISCITTGALIRAGAEHDAERPFNLDLALRTGLALLWRIVGLRVLLLLLFVVLFFAGFAVLILLFGFLTLSGRNGFAVAVTSVVVFGGLVLVLMAAGVALDIAGQLGIRALVLEQRGIGDALARGFRMLVARPGRSLLVWLIALALGILAGIGTALVYSVAAGLALTIAPLSLRATFGAMGALAAGLLLSVLLGFAAIGLPGIPGTYLSLYWTLAYRRIEADAAPAPRPPPQAVAGRL